MFFGSDEWTIAFAIADASPLTRQKEQVSFWASFATRPTDHGDFAYCKISGQRLSHRDQTKKPTDWLDSLFGRRWIDEMEPSKTRIDKLLADSGIFKSRDLNVNCCYPLMALALSPAQLPLSSIVALVHRHSNGSLE